MAPPTAPSRLLGMHWIFDAHGVAAERLVDLALLRDVLAETPGVLGLTMVSPPQCFQHGPEDGRSCAGIVLLSESHFSLHAFPAEGSLHGDLFSCRAFDVAIARRYLEERFGFASIREAVFDRRGGVDGGLDVPHAGG